VKGFKNAVKGSNISVAGNFPHDPTAPNTNPMFGRPRDVLDPGRRLQFGLRYGF